MDLSEHIFTDVQKFLASLTAGKLNVNYSFKDNGLGA
jgi:hypothetical protein